MKCPDFDVSPVVDLTLPSQPSSPAIYLCFLASHFQSVQELIVLKRVEKLMFSKRQHRQKEKIYICIVYGLALHEFSVVESG